MADKRKPPTMRAVTQADRDRDAARTSTLTNEPIGSSYRRQEIKQDTPTQRIMDMLASVGDPTQHSPAGPAQAVAWGGGQNLKHLRRFAQANQDDINLDSFPDWFGDFVEYMNSKYPRVMSHQPKFDNATFSLAAMSDALGMNRELSPGAAGLSTISLRPTGITPETAFHEQAHTIQRLRDPKGLSQKYTKAAKSVGYQNNPYEVAARAFGANQAAKFNKWRAQSNAPRVVLNLDTDTDVGAALADLDMGVSGPIRARYDTEAFRAAADKFKKDNPTDWWGKGDRPDPYEKRFSPATLSPDHTDQVINRYLRDIKRWDATDTGKKPPIQTTTARRKPTTRLTP